MDQFSLFCESRDTNYYVATIYLNVSGNTHDTSNWAIEEIIRNVKIQKCTYLKLKQHFLIFLKTHYYTVPYPELFWSQYTGLGSQTPTLKLSKVWKLIQLKIDKWPFMHHSRLFIVPQCAEPRTRVMFSAIQNAK